MLIGAERRCVRLVTTRVPRALQASAERVVVDRMSPGQARRVLAEGLPEMPADVEGVGRLRPRRRTDLLGEAAGGVRRAEQVRRLRNSRLFCGTPAAYRGKRGAFAGRH